MKSTSAERKLARTPPSAWIAKEERGLQQTPTVYGLAGGPEAQDFSPAPAFLARFVLDPAIPGRGRPSPARSTVAGDQSDSGCVSVGSKYAASYFPSLSMGMD